MSSEKGQTQLHGKFSGGMHTETAAATVTVQKVILEVDPQSKNLTHSRSSNIMRSSNKTILSMRISLKQSFFPGDSGVSNSLQSDKHISYALVDEFYNNLFSGGTSEYMQ